MSCSGGLNEQHDRLGRGVVSGADQFAQFLRNLHDRPILVFEFKHPQSFVTV